MFQWIKSEGDLVPSLSIAVSSVFWGIYWIPLRYLEEGEVHGIWPALTLNAALLFMLVPFFFWRRRQLMESGPRLLVDCICLGFAITLYGNALIFTDVVRAVLLFYLSPAWSTIIGILWLGERLNWRRAGALAFGFTGLLVILEVDQGGVPLPSNMGDWMALISGIVWAIGSAIVFTSKKHSSIEISFGFVFMAVLSGLAIYLVFPESQVGAPPSGGVLTELGPVIVLAAIFLVWPTVFFTIWGTRRLSPARVGILLMGEIVVGVSTAAMLTDEPFGLREFAGAALVVSAGLLEVWPSRQPRIEVPGGPM